MQLQGVKLLLFCMLLGKLMFLKSVGGKEKPRLLNATEVLREVSGTIIKDIEKFIHTVCYFGKEEGSLSRENFIFALPL